MKELQTKIGQIEIRNPLILASGILGTSYSSLNRAFDDGFGCVTTKSIGVIPRKGHPNPSIIYLSDTKSVLNAVGLANPGYKAFTLEIAQIHKHCNYNVSLFGSNPEQFVQMIEYIDNHTSKHPPLAYELNLSCPHADKVGMAVGTDPEIVGSIISSVKLSTKIPIWVKLTPNITDIVPIAEAAISAGVDALVAINTLKAIAIDIRCKKPILANIRGGLSGKAIKPIGLRMIYDLFDKFGSKIPLIGLGGISKWQDVIEYMLAGASAVQIGSALNNYNNPKELITTMLNGLEQYLIDEEIDLLDLWGKAHE